MTVLTSFIEKFRIVPLGLRDFDHWTVSLRPLQPTVGSLIISARREVLSFAQLTEAEAGEYGQVTMWTDTLLTRLFNPEVVNYLSLMLVDRQLHTHVIPRYASSRRVSDHHFSDNCWPKPHDLVTYSLSHSDLDWLLAEFRRAID